ncbi:hypothetical protein E2C01_009520 [Portunus trituberculatus]|uniref:Uncharacterized protein n=1 Tax=Portunus trituberculatus TaxID=210409 RepID=A0A5B7D602_PORTR|nr:hypothetical protein [Portunus trituberculatus]
MADFVETDSPLPTPTLERKFIGARQDPKSTPPFVRKGCFRRKGGGKAEGSSQKRDGRTKEKSSRKDHDKGGVVATSYRKLCHTLSSGRMNAKESHSAAVTSQESRPSPTVTHHVISTNGSVVTTPTHTIAQTVALHTKTPPDRSSGKGGEKQRSSGEKPVRRAVPAVPARSSAAQQENSDEEEKAEENNVVCLSFKKISDTDTQFETNMTQRSVPDCAGQDSARNDIMHTQTKCSGAAAKEGDEGKDGGQAAVRSVRPTGWAEPLFRPEGSPSGRLRNKSAVAEEHIGIILRRQPGRSSDRKIPNTPERTVAVLRRGSLQDRCFMRWSTFTDFDFESTPTYFESSETCAEEKIEASPSRTRRKDVSSRCHRNTDESPHRREETSHKTPEVRKPDSSPLNQPALGGEASLADAVGSKDTPQQREVALKKALMKLGAEFGKKSEKSIFDNLVSICSETMASSMRHCQAESPNDAPGKMTDVGREQAALLFGGIVKEFVARLPSDVDQIRTSLLTDPLASENLSGPYYSPSQEPTDTLKVMQEAIEKACDGLLATNVPEVPEEPPQAAPDSQAPETTDTGAPVRRDDTKTNTFVFPSFAKMEESKVLSRRGSMDRRASLDLQEFSRVRLSKTGKIEVVNDGSGTDDDLDREDETQDSPRPPDDPPPASDTPPVTKRRPSLTERLSQWRLSWSFKNNPLPPQPLPVRSESLKLRAQQRRGSVPDFPSRRFSFSGTFNDLHRSYQNQQESSITEAPPALKGKAFLEQPTSAAANRRRGSVASCLTLAPPQADSVYARRASFDDRLKKSAKESVDKASDAFSYFLDYPVLHQGKWALRHPHSLYLHVPTP